LIQGILTGESRLKIGHRWCPIMIGLQSANRICIPSLLCHRCHITIAIQLMNICRVMWEDLLLLKWMFFKKYPSWSRVSCLS
jgi:hypothetical protein